MKKNSFSVFEANLTYMVMAFVLLTAGAYFQEKSFVSGIFITEYILVLSPVILVGLLRKVDLKKALRLNKLTLKQAGIITCIAWLLLPTVAFANTITLYLLSLIDKVLVPPIPTATNMGEFGLYFFLIAISAGLCEEVFFRGMMLNAFESKINRKWGVILSAVLFGVFHFNMQNLFGPIVLGLVFGYLVQLTNSLWAGILAHTVNNGTAVVLGYLANKSMDSEVMAEAQAQQIGDSAQLLITLGVSLVIAALFWVGIHALIKVLRNDVYAFEDNSKFSVRGVDYLVLSQYNGSVAAIRVDSIDKEDAQENIKHVELKALKRLNPQNLTKLWTDPVRERPVWYHYLPWLGVIALYGWYINLHLNYTG